MVKAKKKGNSLKKLKLLVLGLFIMGFTLQAQENNSARIHIKIVSTLGETVKPQKASTGSDVRTGVVALDHLNRRFSVSSIKRVFPTSSKYELRHKKHGLHLWYELEVDSNEEISQVIQEYSKLKEVTKAELKLLPQLINPNQPTIYSGSHTKSTSTELPFNDPLLDKQWHYNNYGQSSSTPVTPFNSASFIQMASFKSSCSTSTP